MLAQGVFILADPKNRPKSLRHVGHGSLAIGQNHEAVVNTLFFKKKVDDGLKIGAAASVYFYFWPMAFNYQFLIELLPLMRILLALRQILVKMLDARFRDGDTA